MGSRLAITWFSLSSLVVIWDALFVFLRPRSLPGGDLHFLFKPYGLYITVDTNYGDMEHSFTICQSWMNVAEVCLQLYTVVLLLKGQKSASFWAFLVSSLTLWKTLIYMLQYTSLCNGSHLVQHLDWSTFLCLFIVPNGVWIVVPSIFLFSYGAEILNIVATHKEKKR
ncbi:uncharacterized protein LOC135349674 [Halichondria panicea]|uniref:uncharacterized protein LOC135349674 n=1 Tax=Halichondria panicea TaxID=6063 RepID=UPI00312B41F3